MEDDLFVAQIRENMKRCVNKEGLIVVRILMTLIREHDRKELYKFHKNIEREFPNER